jgi:hypothetical protein
MSYAWMARLNALIGRHTEYCTEADLAGMPVHELRGVRRFMAQISKGYAA